MSKSSSRSGGHASSDHLELIPYRPEHSWPVQLLLMLWRWTIELVLIALVVIVVVKVHHKTGWSVFIAVIAVAGFLTWLSGLLYLIPETRYWLPGAFLCLVTRHRMRVFFLQARVFNRSAHLPWILLVRPTPVGERVWIYVVPGLSVDDFTRSTERIAAACSARSVRVERTRRFASLVRVDVVRRDPLMAGSHVPSVLIPDTARDTGAGVGVDAAVAVPLGMVHVPVDLSEPVWGSPTVKKTGINPTGGTGVPAARAAGSQTNSQANSKGTGKAALSSQDGALIPSSPAVITRGGEDVSDYV